jgi:Pvc16 N-terminal domain
MPLLSTRDAIGAVSEAVRSQLQSRCLVLTTVKRPEVAALEEVGAKLNLFLYQIDFDPHLKNHSLDEGQPPPLWLVLRYLITAYDAGNDSDTVAAHNLLGTGLACLQTMNFLNPVVPALADNPEPLKLSFDSSDVELLSKVMQGSEEKYRISAAFQVRPVLIAPDVPPSYAPLVLTVGPPGAEGVAVLPSMGPVLKQITPLRFEAGAMLEFAGDGINSSIESVLIGSMELSVIAAREGAVKILVPNVPTISAGFQPACVARRLPSGRQQTSNPLFVSLLPTLTTAVPGVLTLNPDNLLFGSITITGERLGGVDDSIFVAFYRDGIVALNLEVTGTALQNSLVVNVVTGNALSPGTYYLILRVNGAQATLTPEVDWTL